MNNRIRERIDAFMMRVVDERQFCEELFRDTTIRVLAAKYAYYVLCEPYIRDVAYDSLEQDWYIMGRALGQLKEDETSPCIDFDVSHPLAAEAIDLAHYLLRRTQ